MASGSVTVIGKDGIPRTSKIETDGSYSIADVPVGDAQIGVHSPDPRPDPEKMKVSHPGTRTGRPDSTRSNSDHADIRPETRVPAS